MIRPVPKDVQIRLLTQAEEINSKDPRLHHLLGEVYLALGDRASALREYEILKLQDQARAEELGKLIGPST